MFVLKHPVYRNLPRGSKEITDILEIRRVSITVLTSGILGVLEMV
jgi:hypothetical protein